MDKDTSPRYLVHWLTAGLLLLAMSSVAGAASFTVTLKNGATFETRYRPSDVDWDDDVAMIVTDLGNPIALLKSEIADVSASAEARGFAYQVDTTTLYLGWSPNDLVEENETGELVPTYDTGGDLPPPLPSFTVQQFVDAPVVGSDTGGIPVFTALGDGGE